MNVYEFAAKLTEQEMDNVIGYWEKQNPSKLKSFKSLMMLGDTKQLAVATVMMHIEQDNHEFYRFAYES